MKNIRTILTLLTIAFLFYVMYEMKEQNKQIPVLKHKIDSLINVNKTLSLKK